MKKFTTTNVFAVTLFASFLVACGGQKNYNTETSLDSSQDKFSDVASIWGGQEVAPGNALSYSVVGLYDNGGKSLCTGTLLGNNVVLTAAHCIGKNPSDMVVFFHVDAQEAAKNRNLVRKVNGAIIFNGEFSPNFQRNKPQHDIALLHYAGSTPPGYGAAEVLPLSEISKLQKGMKMLAIGYGLSNPQEKTGSGRLRFAHMDLLGLLNEGEIVLDMSKGEGVCSGDSGGPGFVQFGSKVYVLGVTSRVLNGCTKLAFYTTAPAYIEWIAKAAYRLRASFFATVR